MASVLALLPQAAAADAAFDGALAFFYAKNCQFVQPDWRFGSQYRLSDAASGSRFLGLSTVYQEGVATYEPQGTRPPSTTFALVRGSQSNDGATIEFSARMKITKSEPAKVSDNDLFVAINGQIESPFGDPGKNGAKCVAGFRASYMRLD